MGYYIYANGAYLTYVLAPETSISLSGLAASTSHTYTVRSFDDEFNTSNHSNEASATTPACSDTVKPSVPASVTASATSCTQVNVSWTASTDTGGSGLKGYNIYRNGVYWKQVLAPATTTSDTGRSASTTYTYKVAAVDNAGNVSAQSSSGSATTPACPNQAPVADAGPNMVTQTLTPSMFDGTGSSDPDGSISSYSWDFGDGTTASGASMSHSYAKAGTYTACKTATGRR
jgi:chitodextrinase